MLKTQKKAIYNMFFICIISTLIAFALRNSTLFSLEKFRHDFISYTWFIELDMQGTKVENNIATLAPVIERDLRSNSDIENLILSVYSNRIVIAFSSSHKVDVKKLNVKLSDNFNSIQDSGVFEKFFYSIVYIPSEKLKAYDDILVFSDDVNSYYRRITSIFSKIADRHIFEFLKPDIEIFIGSNDIKTEYDLGLILQSIQGISGVQKAVVKNFHMPILLANLDTRQMLQLGIRSNNVFESIGAYVKNETWTEKNIFGRHIPILDESIRSLNDICNINISAPISRKLVRLCDISQVQRELINIPVFFPNMPVSMLQHFTEKKLIIENELPKDVKTSVALFLEPKVLPYEILPNIKTETTKILKNRQNNDFLIEYEKSTFDSLQMMIISILSFLLFCALLFVSVNINMFFLLSIANLWVNILILANVIPTIFDVYLFCLFVFSFVFMINISKYVPSLNKYFHPLNVFGIFPIIVAFGLATVNMLLYYDSINLIQLFARLSSLFSIIFVYFLISSSLMVPIVADNVIYCHSQKWLSSFAICASMVVVSLFFYNYGSVMEVVSLRLEAGFGRRANPEILMKFANKLQEVAQNNKISLKLLEPTYSDTINIAASDFSLLKSNLFSPADFISIVSPQILGRSSIKISESVIESMPIIVNQNATIGNNIESYSKVDAIKSWIETLRVPEYSLQNDNSKQAVFFPLSTLLRVSKTNTLSRMFITDKGYTLLSELNFESSKLESIKKQINQMVQEFQKAQFIGVSSAIYSSAELEIDSLINYQRSSFLLSLVLLIVGAIYFSSLQRGFLMAGTHMVLDMVVHAVRAATYLVITFKSPPLVTQFPSNETWVSLFILIFWAIIIRSSDYRRVLNMTLKESFAPQFLFIKESKAFMVVFFLILISLSYLYMSSIEYISILSSCLAVYVSIVVFVPAWILFWTHLSEIKNKLVLKYHIKLLKILSILLFLTLGVINNKAQAATTITNNRCVDVATVVLPIIGRPKGKEIPPQKSIFSERITHEIPCAWYDKSLITEITEIVEKNRGVYGQESLVNDLSLLVSGNKQNFINNLQQSTPVGFKPNRIRFLGGFYEEFFGNISYTLIEFLEGNNRILSKITFPEEQQIDGISELAKYLRGDSLKFYEEILGKGERIPVFIEKVESLDKHPVSENLAGEIDLFLKSRFLFPISFNLFERKTFFRYEKEINNSNFVLSAKIRRDDTKLYALLSATVRGTNKRTSAWVEGDISQLPPFEEEILSASKKILSDLENITDYCIAIMGDFLFDFNSVSNLYGINFRQNLGNAAISMRLRSGEHKSPIDSSKYSLLALGGALGWQFVDLRWFVSDAGLSSDVGISTPTKAVTSAIKRNFWLSYGAYAQSQLTFWEKFSILGRVGLEQPQLFADKKTRAEVFSAYYINWMLGIGMTF